MNTDESKTHLQSVINTNSPDIDREDDEKVNYPFINRAEVFRMNINLLRTLNHTLYLLSSL